MYYRHYERFDYIQSLEWTIECSEKVRRSLNLDTENSQNNIDSDGRKVKDEVQLNFQGFDGRSKYIFISTVV